MYNNGGDIDVDLPGSKLSEISLNTMSHYENGHIGKDEYFPMRRGSHTNGYLPNVQERVTKFAVVLELTENEKRFGFSVVGGEDEGFRPRIDEIVEGLPAARKGVRIGDEIEKVNDKSIRSLTHAQIVTTILESVQTGTIKLTLNRINLPMSDDTNSLPVRGRLGNRNSNFNEENTSMSLKTRGKSLQTNGDNERLVNAGMSNGDVKMSATSSYTSGSTLSLTNNGNANSSPLRTIDRGFVGVDNYGYDYRRSQFGIIVPSYNEAVHGPTRTSHYSSVDSDDVGVPVMDSNDCLDVVSTLKRHAVDVDDEELMLDLRILESYLQTKHFNNALSVQCKIMELENQGRGPHFVSAHRDDSSVIREQITNFISNQRVLSSEAHELSDILNSDHLKQLLIAHDRAAKIDRPNFVETGVNAGFDRTDSSRISRGRISADRVSMEDDEEVKIVKIEKTDDPLGATVRNEGSAVIIGRVVEGGAAQKSGVLREGDEIIEINGVNMVGKTVDEFCELLADMSGTLTFLIRPSNKTQSIYSSAELHVRALFDYDPNDDEFVPCKELGLSFSKRDVLHVVNQADTNWWQAWREGTSGQELAGLIPGENLQKQRVKLTKEKGKENKKRKRKKCGCFRKNRGKNLLSDSEDEDNLLIYEQVGLFRQSRNQKRPIVLIGPKNIGRRELRQRLLQVAPERFGSAVPYTSRHQQKDEMNGKEYYFVTRKNFMDLIARGKFVEHGEQDKHLYGTSLDSIEEVVKSGKVCIVNLHCQGLKVLRESELKPYSVFICPPTVEKIKRLRRDNVDSFNPNLKKLSSDEELVEMVMSAQKMEDNFGHYFDKIIVNTDLERTFDELIKTVNELETKPQWVPVRWVGPR